MDVGDEIREDFSYDSRQRRRVGEGRRLNGFLGLSLNDRTILFLGIVLDKTVSVG